MIRLADPNSLIVSLIVFVQLLLLGANHAGADELAKLATWQAPSIVQMRAEFSDWLKQINAPTDIVNKIDRLIETEFPPSVGENLDIVFQGLLIARPELNEVVEQLKHQRNGDRSPEFNKMLDDEFVSPFYQSQVRLYLARWLVQNEFYDEALVHFHRLDLNLVSDPAALLFYRGLAEHQLLRQEDCVATMQLLLENESQLPRRFGVLSKLVLADIKTLEENSLDEISRLMGDAGRRTGLHRSGTIVRDEEKQIIEKLDSLITQLESQQSQAQPAGGAANNPLQNSQRKSGKGSGDVTQKHQDDGGQWGDLPPAERGAALAEMVKEMPPHYREVIEEYFRQLANEKE